MNIWTKFSRNTLTSIFFDCLAVLLSYFGAMWIRFDFRYSLIPSGLSSQMLIWAPFFTGLAIFVYIIFRLYRSLVEFVGLADIIRAFAANICLVIIQFLMMRLIFQDIWVPIGFFLIEFFLLFIGVVSHRLVHRFLMSLDQNVYKAQSAQASVKTMIVGAGEAGRMLLHEVQVTSKINIKVVALIDDDPGKKGKYINGVKIYGGRDLIPEIVKKLDIKQIIVAVPSAGKEEQREILEYCKNTDADLKIVPGIYQILSGEVSVSKLRDVSLEDLLGREEIHVNSSQIGQYLKGKKVLVTGGGGTIGSELCRQIANFKPKQIIIFDVNENGSYSVQQELHRKFPDLDIEIWIGSIRDRNRLSDVFRRIRPDIVYHAAAHKHVHLMEMAPLESIKNNALGTRNVAEMADRYGVDRFVLISTDKAVNPTNIYGATKRMCEMIIQAYDERSKTDFVAVRFGNVLGSSGSVIPLFKKQIEEGGPVTVTHPDIVRFFMTIPEAVSLVLQAGTFGSGGEIFVLDMGEPVKIVDMAKNLIRLSGLKLGEDIDIVFTGLRPGEKLYEEVLMSEEGLSKTSNNWIRIAQPLEFNAQDFFKRLDDLEELIKDETVDVTEPVMEMVDTYKKAIEGIPVDKESFEHRDSKETRDQVIKAKNKEAHKYDPLKN